MKIEATRTITKRLDKSWAAAGPVTLTASHLNEPVVMSVIGYEHFKADTPDNGIFGFGLRTRHNANLIEIAAGSLGRTCNHPAFNVGIHHVFKLKDILVRGKPEKNTWYHLCLEWNDYGEYRFVASKCLIPEVRKFIYVRRLGSLLTTKTCRLKSMHTVEDGFIWEKPPEKKRFCVTWI